MPTKLGDLLEFLAGLRWFSCGSNPWKEPPAALLGDKGNLPGVKSYFVDLYREKRVVSRSLKVVLVGREGTGKTRCSNVLQILEIPAETTQFGARIGCLPAALSPDILHACLKIKRGDAAHGPLARRRRLSQTCEWCFA